MGSNGLKVLRVLLIEDDFDEEELVERALQKGGFAPIVHRVETEAALELAISSEAWDVILCDIIMPHFSAVRALEISKERLDDIPFIILSGLESEDEAIKFQKLGAHDYVFKSDLSRLSQAIRKEIRSAGDRLLYRLEMEKNYSLTIQAWGIALERRDIHTKNHTVRVTDLTLRFARSLGVSSSQFKSIYYGSLLHDIGKMGIPDSILIKPGPLDPSEMAIMRMHPGIALEMLSSIEFLEKAVTIPYCHHEKFDGTGYPRGLEGDRIPFEARIFSICDVFDAITSERPYRRSMTHKEAVAHIESEKGKSFDPDLVDKFIEVIK